MGPKIASNLVHKPPGPTDLIIMNSVITRLFGRLNSLYPKVKSSPWLNTESFRVMCTYSPDKNIKMDKVEEIQNKLKNTYLAKG